MRVEVEAAPHDDLEIPEIESRPAGNRSLPILFGLFVVVALGLLLLGLSPDEDQAADGTLREAPSTTAPTTIPATTTTPTTTTPTTTDDQDAEMETAPELVLPDLAGGADGRVRARESELTDSLRSVIPTENGFLGITGTSAANPELVASSDGVSWVDVETTVLNPSSVDLTNHLVVELSLVPEQVGDGFVMLALDFSISQRGDQPFRTAILTSLDGAVWEVVDTTEPQAEGRVPRLLLGNSIVATVDEGAPIDELIATYTDLVIAGEPVCSVNRQVNTSDPRLWLGLCNGAGSVLIGEGNIIRDVDPSVVLACALSLSPEQSGTRTALRLLDLEAGANSPLGSGDGGFFLGPNLLPDLLPLEAGGVAVFDVGSTADPACAGVVDLGPDREPSIVLLDANTGSEEPFALPIEGESVRLVGETRRFADQDAYVLVEIDANLWGLNPSSGAWAILTSNQGGSASEFYAVSESGSRAYQLFGETLRVIDFALRPGGSGLFAVQREIPIDALLLDLAPPRRIVPFLTSNVLFASDELIMVASDLGRLWLITTPTDSSDTPTAFSEDLGGVGLAR